MEKGKQETWDTEEVCGKEDGSSVGSETEKKGIAIWESKGKP